MSEHHENELIKQLDYFKSKLDQCDQQFEEFFEDEQLNKMFDCKEAI